MNPRWLVMFITQVAVGTALVFLAPEPGAYDLGLLLLGGALGQGLTAQATARSV